MFYIYLHKSGLRQSNHFILLCYIYSKYMTLTRVISNALSCTSCLSFVSSVFMLLCFLPLSFIFPRYGFFCGLLMVAPKVILCLHLCQLCLVMCPAYCRSRLGNTLHSVYNSCFVAKIFTGAYYEINVEHDFCNSSRPLFSSKEKQ